MSLLQVNPYVRVLTPLGEGDLWFIETFKSRFSEYHVMLDLGFIFVFTHDLIRKSQDLTEGVVNKNDPSIWKHREADVKKLRDFFGYTET